jgi:hypothetical protein
MNFILTIELEGFILQRYPAALVLKPTLSAAASMTGILKIDVLVVLLADKCYCAN